jgi:hypothetical protein
MVVTLSPFFAHNRASATCFAFTGLLRCIAQMIAEQIAQLECTIPGRNREYHMETAARAGSGTERDDSHAAVFALVLREVLDFSIRRFRIFTGGQRLMKLCRPSPDSPHSPEPRRACKKLPSKLSSALA